MDKTLFDKLKEKEVTPSVVWEIFTGKGLQVENGYTKVVIVSEKEDFVIKIPRDDSVRYNYCERESHVYEKAVKWGIEFMFAKTTRMGVIDKSKHKYYYRQPKVEKFGYCLNRNDELMEIPVIERQVRKAMQETKINSMRVGCSSEWYAYVLKAYGYDNLVKLLLFLKVAKINDLRSDNVGFINGKPVLVDYSGFHGGHRD